MDYTINPIILLSHIDQTGRVEKDAYRAGFSILLTSGVATIDTAEICCTRKSIGWIFTLQNWI